MTVSEFRNFLLGWAASLGIDTSESSPYVDYIIEPVVGAYEKIFNKYVLTVEWFYNNVYIEPTDAFLSTLAKLLGLEGSGGLIRGTGILEPSAQLAQNLLPYSSRTYADGEVTFYTPEGSFNIKAFTVRKTDRVEPVAVEFEAQTALIETPPAVGYRYAVAHPDFSYIRITGVIGSEVVEAEEIAARLKDTIKNLRMLRKDEYQRIVEEALQLPVDILGPGDDFFYRDVVASI